MRFDVVSLFPDMFGVVRDQGVTGRAHKHGLWSLGLWNPRDFTHDVHRTVDDRPYGGGPGMVMMADPLEQSVKAALAQRQAFVDTTLALNELNVLGVADKARPVPGGPTSVLLMSPTGRRFDQSMAARLRDAGGAILVCGRYEGIDQRFVDRCITEEVSIGDFVLSGGEIPALAIIDSVVRLLPGALNDADSALQDSFNVALDGLLDCPHYTRPEHYQGQTVPAELLSGHHINIALWRRRQSLELTARRRPDLIAQARLAGLLSRADEQFLAGLVDDSK
ncbi:MAG: tRNA (guanosine(37)-N1)-methyltransferase TrmD [Candidimonas sp.]|nr:MAG: tRNA (guanosine(37)-N1)-methyltransferase TrmD [Candidimonas sp.]TAM22955.1 MAG: tRNA (guanosine(37)-N1)-methyltransferase TrmD [Candidimonas sp.]TAM77583.1 MAG: tRNA (guanosine(37)-N1)-methyltransferase TrmD [Candidimonas sp.]